MGKLVGGGAGRLVLVVGLAAGFGGLIGVGPADGAAPHGPSAGPTAGHVPPARPAGTQMPRNATGGPGVATPGIGSFARHQDGTVLAALPPAARAATSSTTGIGATQMFGASCVTSSDCMAVGMTDQEGTSARGTYDQPFAEEWNGSSWTATAVPWPTVSTVKGTLSAYGQLNSVSCASASFCVAVGYADNAGRNTRYVVLDWDGSVWSKATVPTAPSNSSLAGVSCSTSAQCQAVGYAGSSPTVPIALDLAGSVWSVDTKVKNVGSYAELFAVSCHGGTFCMSVGVSYSSGTAKWSLLAESWSAGTWALRPPHNPSTTYAELDAVSCVRATWCMAVGHDSTSKGVRALAERWNGSGWSVVSVPQPGTLYDYLWGVACISPTSCQAVGDQANAYSSESAIKGAWTGSAWKVPSGSQTAGHWAWLYAVACTTASSCEAVGASEAGSSPYMALAMRLAAGTWKTVRAASGTSPGRDLYGVACAGSSFCAAVGQSFSEPSYQTFAETWNGSAWTVRRAPNEGDSSWFNAVSCSSATSCLAVGGFDTLSGRSLPLAAKWNGASWSLVPVPTTGSLAALSAGADLIGLACATASHCEAVGWYTSKTVTLPLALGWNGNAWSFQKVPEASNEAAKSPYLFAISCPSGTACMAIGAFYQAGGGIGVTFNGTKWSLLPSAASSTLANSSNKLYSVSCVSKSFCMLVGEHGPTASMVPHALLWNGSALSASSPSSSSPTELEGVSCLSKASCVVVDDAASGRLTTASALIWQGGHSWTTKAVLSQADASLYPAAVVCRSTSACQAVGTTATGYGDELLAISATSSGWSVTQH